ncbi:10931_t:CDS:1, partial [Paraglomus brasilianum]
QSGPLTGGKIDAGPEDIEEEEKRQKTQCHALFLKEGPVYIYPTFFGYTCLKGARQFVVSVATISLAHPTWFPITI